MDPTLPPTYLTKLERRHWIREEFAHAVVPNILLNGGEPEKWKTLMTLDPRFVDVSAGPDQLHVIVGNTMPTDSLAGQVMRMLIGRCVSFPCFRADHNWVFPRHCCQGWICIGDR